MIFIAASQTMVLDPTSQYIWVERGTVLGIHYGNNDNDSTDSAGRSPSCQGFTQPDIFWSAYTLQYAQLFNKLLIVFYVIGFASKTTVIDPASQYIWVESGTVLGAH